MRTLLFTTLLALAAIAGCSKQTDGAADRASKIPTISIDDLDKKLASGECRAVDANGNATRKKLGVIPGAVLLSDSDTFNAGELPPDKAKGLVFYCTNQQCGASDEAAVKAIAAGYTNVKVLPDGIAGWKNAGKKIDQI